MFARWSSVNPRGESFVTRSCNNNHNVGWPQGQSRASYEESQFMIAYLAELGWPLGVGL